MRRKVSTEQLAALRELVRRESTRITGHVVVDSDGAGTGVPASASAVPQRAELAAATRTICALLEQRFPGGTVELRVPPFAAVQLGLGDRGRHTRGTPPNVVQTDAETLLKLAAGILGWPEAVAAHQVRASGVLSDLSGLWPLPELSSGQPPGQN